MAQTMNTDTLHLEKDYATVEGQLPEGVHDVAVFHVRRDLDNDTRWNITYGEEIESFDLRETHAPVAVFRNINARSIFGMTQHIEESWVENAEAAGHEIMGERIRSTSVGDVVVIGGTAYRCEGVGWTSYVDYHICPGPACCWSWD